MKDTVIEMATDVHAHNDLNARLYEASINGDVDALNELIREDRLVLTRITPTFFHENPLHIAALHGHSDYAKALLRHNPGLVGEVDAWGHTALHLAAAKGHVAAVKALLEADCSACLRCSRDGKLPPHLAIMKMHMEIVQELLEAHPEAARKVLDRGGTVLHLCVRFNHLEALRVIVEEINDDEFLASVDEDGNTILHLAALFKHLKIVEYILPKAGRGMANALNKSGFTALDMAVPRDVEGLEMENFLIKAGIPRAKDRPPSNSTSQNGDQVVTAAPRKRKKSKPKFGSCITSFFSYDTKWAEDMRGGLMVAATLTATMAFQVVLQPPGGIWPGGNSAGHVDGSAVAATDDFFTYNTFALLSSMSVILLLVSGLPVKKSKLCVWILMLLIWATLTFMTLTYSESIKIVDNPDRKLMQNGSPIPSEYPGSAIPSEYPAGQQYNITTLAWRFLLGGVMLYHTLTLVVWLAGRLKKVIVSMRKKPTLRRGVSVVA